LRLHRVLAGAIKGLDAQMLLDPLEKQLHLPTLFVDVGDGQWRKREIVGQELQSPVGFGIVVAHLSRRVPDIRKLIRTRTELRSDLSHPCSCPPHASGAAAVDV